jgi:hypothetical protein
MKIRQRTSTVLLAFFAVMLAEPAGTMAAPRGPELGP